VRSPLARVVSLALSAAARGERLERFESMREIVRKDEVEVDDHGATESVDVEFVSPRRRSFAHKRFARGERSQAPAARRAHGAALAGKQRAH